MFSTFTTDFFEGKLPAELSRKSRRYCPNKAMQRPTLGVNNAAALYPCKTFSGTAKNNFFLCEILSAGNEQIILFGGRCLSNSKVQKEREPQQQQQRISLSK